MVCERDAYRLVNVAVRSRSQNSIFAVSNDSLSSSGDSINNSNHELLESPLDAAIERLHLQSEDTQIDELAKHPVEGWIRGGYTTHLGP